MDKDTLPLQLRTRYITGLTPNIQAYFEKETGVRYPAKVVDDALQTWLESRFDSMIEGLGEVITSPHLAESQVFRRILEERMEAAAPAPSNQKLETRELETSVDLGHGTLRPETSPDMGLGTIFTGARAYSPEKLGAMIEYIAARGRDIYKTNLNKLLFYSDLTHYYLHGRGISGATYVNLPYGPVPETVETVIDNVAAAGRVRRQEAPDRGANAQMIVPGEAAPAAASLDKQETDLIDWVLDTYGDLSPTEISEVSHAEKAYKFTRPQEPIAYEYAKFFAKLPAKE